MFLQALSRLPRNLLECSSWLSAKFSHCYKTPWTFCSDEEPDPLTNSPKSLQNPMAWHQKLERKSIGREPLPDQEPVQPRLLTREDGLRPRRTLHDRTARQRCLHHCGHHLVHLHGIRLPAVKWVGSTLLPGPAWPTTLTD